MKADVPQILDPNDALDFGGVLSAMDLHLIHLY